MPQISVIVPVYKVEQYLDRCVESILAQTFTDFELILVDDGSPDNCPAKCDTWKKRDSRIKVIHKKNGGLSDARNAGLNIATGEYISFVDSDDYIHPKMYELMRDIMTKTQSKLVSCRIQEVEANVQIDFPMYAFPTEIATVDSKTALELFYEKYSDLIWMSACVKLYHRSIFEELRFRQGIIFEDLDLFPYIVAKADQITVIDNVLYYNVKNPNSITRNGFNEHYIDIIEIWGRHMDFFLEQGLLGEAQHAVTRYIQSLITIYQKIRRSHKALKPLFWQGMKKNYNMRRREIKGRCAPSRMQRMILNIFPCFPYLAEKIYEYISR